MRVEADWERLPSIAMPNLSFEASNLRVHFVEVLFEFFYCSAF